MADEKSREFGRDLYLKWWGLHRYPVLYTRFSLSKMEQLGAVLTLSLAALLLLLIIRNSPFSMFVPHITEISLVIMLLALIVGLFLPAGIFGDGFYQILILSKERRGLNRYDLFMIAAAIAGVVLVGIRGLSRITTSEYTVIMRDGVFIACIGVMTIVAGILLHASMPAEFIGRHRLLEFPKWLNENALYNIPEEGERKGEIPLILVEADASFSYPFPADNLDKLVGVNVPKALLEELRRINVEHNGALYQEDPPKGAQAVVLGTDAPVNSLGVDEMKRLVKQMLTRSWLERYTSYELADHLLRFTQRNIEYAYDEDTTPGIVGQRMEEYGRFPLETLIDGKGDCECTSLLCASLLAYAGFYTALIFVRLKATAFEPESYHVAVGLDVDKDPIATHMRPSEGASLIEADGARYLYGETATDRKDPDPFGVIPSLWRRRMEIREVVSIPPLQKA